MRFRPTEQALVKPLDDGAMALNLQTGEYYTLNELATRMWQMLEAGWSEEEIIAAVVADYQVDAQTVTVDLARLVRELLDRGMIAAA